MASSHSRAGTLQKRRSIQIAAGVACVAFVGMALGAVVVDRSVEPAPAVVLPPSAPIAGGAVEDEYEPFPPLIASGLSSVYTLKPEDKPDEGPKDPRSEEAPPQDIVLVAAIGQPGSMMAVIREGAAQTAIAEGQRGGSVDVLEVRPGYARVRYRGEERELTIGQPLHLVSDMGAAGDLAAGSQIITPPGAIPKAETLEEQGVTRTRMPTAMQRAQSSGNSGGGGSDQGDRGRRGGGGNSGTSRPPAGGTPGNNNNGPGAGAEDDR